MDMKIGLIDVDGHNYPNLALMKLSAWHKQNGDQVEWYYPLTSGHMDRVYLSKVFSFTPDYDSFIDADEVVQGGSGYSIQMVEGKEKWFPVNAPELPYDVEHIYPDYELYGVTDTAYGFLTRGCPRNCGFCIVSKKEGNKSVKVADLSEFWSGQKNIELLDPNMFACPEWPDLAEQLIDSKAWVNFSQGVDIRIMTFNMAQAIAKMKIKTIHFAWDRYKDQDIVLGNLQMLKDATGFDKRKMIVYVLTNYDTTFEQDLDRIMKLREIGCDPYVMIYEKYDLSKKNPIYDLQRWVNNRIIWGRCNTFEEYKRGERS